MDGDEDDDMHICLVCQATVTGLANYVNHKKNECPGRKGLEKNKTPEKNQLPISSQQPLSEGQSFIQLLSSASNQFTQPQIFSGQFDSSQISPGHSLSQLSPHQPNNMYSMSTSPSHGLQFSTNITFSEDIGPVMSLRPNSGSDMIPTSVSTSKVNNSENQKSTNENEALTSTSSQPTQSLSLNTNEQYLTIQPGGFSPPSGNIVDPNMVMSSRSDFFSSLALQKKSEKDSAEQKDGLTSDLPISNILNNLDLYNDEDLDFVFSDDDFLQDAFSEESDDDSIPPPNHTSGKWKPGEGPSYRSKVVWQPGRRPMHPSRGKWRPGEMPARGKLQSHILARQKEKAKEEELKSKKKNEGGKKVFHCMYCDLDFTNRFQYSNHCMRKEHKANVSNYRKIKNIVKSLDETNEPVEKEMSKHTDVEIEDKKEEIKKDKEKTTDDQTSIEEETEVKPEKPVYSCAICEKKFNNKYIMARHLLSTYHKNRTKGHPNAIKVLEQYHKYIVWLSPYQCTICQYYFNRKTDFMDHLRSTDHKLQCESLDGEMMCSICKYCCHDNTSLIKHFHSDNAHRVVAQKSMKPCIIKEKNYDTECKICKKILHSKLHMKRHMRAQHFKEYSEYELTCKLCNKYFLDSFTYRRHMRTSKHCLRAEQKKKFGKVVESEEETEVFNEGVIRTHINRKVEKPYRLAKKSNVKKMNRSHKCNYCDFVATEYNELRPHYLEQHANHVFVCELCDLTFLTEKARKVHFAGIKHQSNLEKSEGKSSAVIEQCDYCDRRFEDEQLKLFHTEVYHLHPNSEDSLREKLGHEDITTMKYQEFLSTVDSLEGERVQCIECPKTIMKDYILEHLRSHSGDKPYKCRYCSSGFAAPLSLRRHLMSHVGLAERKCEICGKEFKKFGSYREHMTKHCLEENNASKLICDVCGQSFLLQKQLNTHMKRHGEKKFKCEYQNCQWSFFLYNELKAHHRSHTGEKTFLCDICGYAAGTKNRLNRHHRTHTGVRDFHCEYCSYKAGTRTHLRRHMRIHTGSKPYKCPYCSYCCNTHENIRKHISKTKKHAGLPIYPCKFCEYGTNNTVEFRFHLEQMHRGEFNFKASDGLAIIAGLYKKDDDPDKPIEGMEIIQVRERKYNLDQPRKPKPKKKNIQYADMPYEIQDHKLEIDYRENHDDFQSNIVDVHVTEWPPEFSVGSKVTPITADMQAYQHAIEPNYSGQIASVGYFMPASTTPTAQTVESGLIPQPPALQVDVVSNTIKWHYE